MAPAESAKEFFDNLQTSIDPEKIKGINATYQWDIIDTGKWYATLTDDGATVSDDWLFCYWWWGL